MGFRKNWDVDAVLRQLRSMASEIRSVNNDGWTACHCKQELWQVKCWLDDTYANLPSFPDQEREWEQRRLIQKLKE